MNKEQQNVENKQRRTILAFGVSGLLALLFGKLFKNDIVNVFVEGDTELNRKDFENFSLVETKDEMVLSDKGGDPIFIIEKDSFRR